MKKISVRYSAFVLLAVFVTVMGCGVKGNPVIYSDVAENTHAISSFKADYTGNAVVLNWDFYSKNSKVSYIAIEKSESGSGGNECKECPGTLERIGRVSAKDAKQGNKELMKFSFTDNKVEKGKAYYYRLLVCDEYNECREKSSIEINLK